MNIATSNKRNKYRLFLVSVEHESAGHEFELFHSLTFHCLQNPVCR